MEDYLKKVLVHANCCPEDDLSNNIWQTIVKRERNIVRFKLWISLFIGLCSLAGFVPVFSVLMNDFAHSGFYEYLSLAFSSSGSIITYWRDFISLLAESLPVISIAMTLSLVFIFFLSLKYSLRAIIKNKLLLSI